MASPPTRILFLDDSPTQLKAAAEALTRAGFQPVTATTVTEAEPFVNSCQIVLIDYNMPGITGAEALAALKSKLVEGSQPRFYLYTTDPSAAKQYRDIGFDGLFVLKGDVNALVKQMESVMRLLKTQAMKRAS
ncbi:MAG: response regulator [Planctomycetes bacterium]|nr:response regulator [Planctomycetota bacterium]